MTQRRGNRIPPHLQQHVQGNYLPEYKRLGRDPFDTAYPGPNAPDKLKMPPPPKNVSYTRKHIPAVGMNEESLWRPASRKDDMRAKIALLEDDHYIDIDSLQGQNQLNVPIYDDHGREVEFIDESEEDNSDDHLQPQVPNNYSPVPQKSFPDVNEYIVLLRKNVLFISDDIAEVESRVEDILLSDNNINKNDIIIMKRLGYSFGLTIDG